VSAELAIVWILLLFFLMACSCILLANSFNSSADEDVEYYGNKAASSLPSKIEILMEKEEIDYGNHDLDDRDEG
jgi:hypothetical protein